MAPSSGLLLAEIPVVPISSTCSTALPTVCNNSEPAPMRGHRLAFAPLRLSACSDGRQESNSFNVRGQRKVRGVSMNAI